MVESDRSKVGVCLCLVCLQFDGDFGGVTGGEQCDAIFGAKMIFIFDRGLRRCRTKLKIYIIYFSALVCAKQSRSYQYNHADLIALVNIHISLGEGAVFSHEHGFISPPVPVHSVAGSCREKKGGNMN